MERELAEYIKSGDMIQVYGYGESDPVIIPPQSARVEEIRFPFFVVTLAGRRRQVPFRLAEIHLISEAKAQPPTSVQSRSARVLETCRLGWLVQARPRVYRS